MPSIYRAAEVLNTHEQQSQKCLNSIGSYITALPLLQPQEISFIRSITGANTNKQSVV